MDRDKIARNNHAFFVAVVGMAMCRDSFAEAVLDSFDKPALYSVERNGYSGYILVDSTDVKHCCSHGSLADRIRDRFLGKVAREVPYSVKGELNAEAEVICGSYKFSFKIVQYERDRDHGFEMVDDPTSLPDNERLGQLVELKITIL